MSAWRPEVLSVWSAPHYSHRSHVIFSKTVVFGLLVLMERCFGCVGKASYRVGFVVRFLPGFSLIKYVLFSSN
jgi:hypothetical protein